ncbi:hypothetical protein CMI47_13915 [Candidatus Pacearchaeota archaeon]|jgi:hypothetical protein|nr:hypothetical protein [Candidatus Pacearchaeota archaeon]|tara:strand:- start:887 stop:1591 length:705 start_codon:yes stop_codon:yes gene_type:complete
MPLPVLSTPTYELTIPSSGQTVQYRPFLVKEEKILLMANEGGEASEIVRAMKQIIGNCIQNGYNTDNMPLFDVEYIFLKLRSKSVNEFSEVGFRCPECDEVNRVQIDLSSVEIFTDDAHSNKVELTNDIGLIMKYPQLDSINMNDLQSTDVDTIFNVVSSCIDSIYQGEEIHDSGDYTKEEISEFINNLTQEQFLKIQQFFDTMPKLSHTVPYTCNKCEYDEPLVLEGLQNFFA